MLGATLGNIVIKIVNLFKRLCHAHPVVNNLLFSGLQFERKRNDRVRLTMLDGITRKLSVFGILETALLPLKHLKSEEIKRRKGKAAPKTA